MSGPDVPRSPFGGMINSAASRSLRVLSRDQIGRILAAHRLYVETERRQGRRADFGSTDLSELNFSGLNLRRAENEWPLLQRTHFTGTPLQKAHLICAASS